MRILVLHLLLGLALVPAHVFRCFASSGVPTEENAYCGKGNVAKFGDKDGPAQLPTSCYYTGMDGTPSPGKQIRVGANSNLSAAVESARCGDTLRLAAGVSFEIKDFPAKNCDDSHYITIRTDTPDSELPREGARVSPAWAGVASLPGRPAYSRPPGGVGKLMPTLLVSDPSGVKVGDHYRFIGIEWTSQPGKRLGRLVTTEGAHHVIFDRNWFHPAEGVEMGKGIMMIHGTRFIAVINSYLNGFNCVARAGACTDASAIGGGNGLGQEINTTFKIYDDFVEASGECILFGGAASDVNPTDIEIRRNHLFRPLIWKEGEPGYASSPSGQPYIVKNNFELKSAIRVLFEANLLENTWGGFSQRGYAILLTPKNQMAKCPQCAVLDVTIRYNRVRNVGGGIVVATGQDKNGAPSAGGGRISIHDLLVDSIHDVDWKGQGDLATVASNAPVLHDLSFDHITAFVTGPIFQVKASNAEKIPNFRVTNSIFAGGGSRPEVTASGRATDCPAPMIQKGGAEAILKECFVNYQFERNLIIGNKGGWPKGTIVVSSPNDAGIRDLHDGVSKDPRLCHTNTTGCSKGSPGASAATDGKDIGANVDAVDAAIAGIE